MARLLSLLSIFVMMSLIAGCTGSFTPTVVLATVAPTVPPPSATPTLAPLPTDAPTVVPSPTNPPLPTATETVVPPTSTPTTAPPTPTPTRTPLPVTKTPKPTQPPVSTKAPTQVPPTTPASVLGADLVAPRGQESCVNKFVPVSYGWHEDKSAGVGMYYWDAKWSVYPMFARPNMKLDTVKGVCNEKNECRGLTADFCVYVDAGAPSGGLYESEATIIIACGTKQYAGEVTRTKTMFRWYIK